MRSRSPRACEMTSGRIMAGTEKVIIIGGGIAGLAAAIALRLRGVETLVLEQAEEIREIGAGLLLAPNACRVLEKLGVLPLLLAGHSMPIAQWELRDWNGRALSMMTIPRAGETSISTRRSDLQWALLQCLPADAVLLGHSVKSAALIDKGVQIELTNGHKISGQRVIVADGAFSAVRDALWPGQEPHYAGYVGWRGLVDFVPEGWAGRVCESWGRGRRFGIADVGNGRTYWYASANVPAAQQHDRVPISQLRRDFGDCHPPSSQILEAVSDDVLLQHPISDRCPPWHWQREEKIVLVGDAAHPLTPNLGQGASMALEDAWEIAIQWGKPDAMVCYERRRRMRLLRLWAASHLLGNMIQWENPILCGLRDAKVRCMPDGLARMIMRRFLHHLPGELP